MDLVLKGSPGPPGPGSPPPGPPAVGDIEQADGRDQHSSDRCLGEAAVPSGGGGGNAGRLVVPRAALEDWMRSKGSR